LLNAGTFPCLNTRYNYIKDINVKKLSIRKIPAEIRSLSNFEVSQRLNAIDLEYAYLVGLIEGDG
jgi:hypothetical protein